MSLDVAESITLSPNAAWPRASVPRYRGLRSKHVPIYRSEKYVIDRGTRGLYLENWRRSDLLLQSTRPFHPGRCEYDCERLLQRSVSTIANGIRRRSSKAARRQPGG